jgi:cardiolipin synthase
VWLQLDAFGSDFVSFRAIRDKLETAGVRSKGFHPFRRLHPVQYVHRNHRKLLVIDERRAFLGGFNIRRLNSRILSGERRQRDTHVHVNGTLARGASVLLDRLLDESEEIQPKAIPETPAGPEAILIPSRSRKCRQRIACLRGTLIERAQRYLFSTSPYFAPGDQNDPPRSGASRRQRPPARPALR